MLGAVPCRSSADENLQCVITTLPGSTVQNGDLFSFLHPGAHPLQVGPAGLHFLLQIQETPETCRDPPLPRGHRGADQKRPDGQSLEMRNDFYLNFFTGDTFGDRDCEQDLH